MKLSNAIGFYIAIVLFLTLFAAISIQLYLLMLVLVSLIYIPLVLAIYQSPRPRVEEEKERIVVDEDIAHFRERVDKALKEKAVAQRDIELRVLNSLVIDLSIRYDMPERVVRRNMDNEEFLRPYLGDKARVVARMFRRIHDLRNPLPREKFLKEINEVLEAME